MRYIINYIYSVALRRYRGQPKLKYVTYRNYLHVDTFSSHIYPTIGVLIDSNIQAFDPKIHDFRLSLETTQYLAGDSILRFLRAAQDKTLNLTEEEMKALIMYIQQSLF